MKSANQSFRLNDWSLGIDWNHSTVALDLRALAECTNFNITKSRSLKLRGGISLLYPTTAGPAQVDIIYNYRAPNGTDYVLVQSGTTIKSYYTAAWNSLVTGLTADYPASMLTHNGYCFIANGVDTNQKLLNTTNTRVGIVAPAAAPTTAGDGSGTFAGTHSHVYCYKRAATSSNTLLISNPSPASTEITVAGRADIKVDYIESSDAQVTHIIIYRTLSIAGEVTYFQVAEVANATSHYHDSVADDDLTTQCEADNAVPPIAKFIVLHGDRIIYANLPNETAGGSKLMWSKIGTGEAVPSANYQYVDRIDGEDISGAASVGDYLIIMKRNKIFVMAGGLTSAEDTQIYRIGSGIGCISPYGIVELAGGAIFLSEEGLKFCDGKDFLGISQGVNRLAEDGYYTFSNKNKFRAVYYPQAYQLYALVRHSTLTDRVLVGHLVQSLTTDSGTSQATAPFWAWTIHEYEQKFTTLGTYTDSDGITRICGGTSDGYVYKLDSGNDDDGAKIRFSAKTGWYELGAPTGYTKTLRLSTFSYQTATADTFTLGIDTDFVSDGNPDVVTGGVVSYVGSCYTPSAACGSPEQIYDMWVDRTGKLFRWSISGSSAGPLEILKIDSQYRIEGMR